MTKPQAKLPRALAFALQSTVAPRLTLMFESAANPVPSKTTADPTGPELGVATSRGTTRNFAEAKLPPASVPTNV